MGYLGQKFLYVDLTTSKSWSESVSEENRIQYLGGAGLGSLILYHETSGGTGPLEPENPLIFAVGPFQGTNLPGSAKWVAVSKSPLTGTFAVSAAGGEFGDQLARAGFDGLVIKGKAEMPTVLHISDHEVSIVPAPGLWGQDAVETSSRAKMLVEDEGCSTVTIGPAGEQQVAVACLCTDSHSFAGRCGLGAVMGSKNLKAVLVRGSKTPDVTDPETLRHLRRDLALRLAAATKDSFRAHGTAAVLAGAEASGDMPVKYWAGDTWPEGAKKLGAPAYTEVLKATPWPCHACPVGCHRRIDLDGEYVIQGGSGPEYESLAMLGSCCLVDDLKIVAQANDLCNRLGIDTISTGAFVAFTMECFEKGLISESDLGGVPARWGDGRFLVEMVKQIGERRGFGAVFANGIRAAVKEIGPEAASIAVEVRGLDFPAHDPRTYNSLAVNYATGTRGACHLRGFSHVGEGGMLLPEVGYNVPPKQFSMDGQAEVAKLFQDYACVLDSLVCCMFMQCTGVTLTETTAALNSITGWDMDPVELMAVGTRIFNLQRLMNIRDGSGGKEDRLPGKMFVPAAKGYRAGRIPDRFNDGLSSYYKIRGWDINGIPTAESLSQIGLTEFSPALPKSDCDESR